MPHADWCGKPCCECEHPCRLDQELYCTPDCPNPGADGGLTEGCEGCEVVEVMEEDGEIKL